MSKVFLRLKRNFIFGNWLTTGYLVNFFLGIFMAKNWVIFASNNFYFRPQAPKYHPIIFKVMGEIFREFKNLTELYATFLRCWSGFKWVYYHSIKKWWNISEKWKTKSFQNKLFGDVSDSEGYSVPFGAWNYVCHPMVLLRSLHAVPSDRKNKRNVGNDKGGNEQYCSSFQAHINSFCLGQ